MGLISDYFRRRRLRPVVGRLPHSLARRYGTSAFYTAGQVRATVNAMQLNPQMFTTAFAVACSQSEFLVADPLFTEERYAQERKDIARLFRIDEQNLNGEFLTSRSFSASTGEVGLDTTYGSTEWN
jgi:hypothetical protein